MFGRSQPTLPDDKLKEQHILPENGLFFCHSGLPFTADSCSYEPVQRLLAITTYDGMLKVYGKNGVERTIRTKHNATRQLLFLQNKGVIIRVSQSSKLEAWSIASESGPDCIKTLPPFSIPKDKVTAVAAVRREPYVLLGCANGDLRIALLVNSSGTAATEPRTVMGLSLQGNRVSAAEMRGNGAVVSMAVYSCGGIQRVLVVHAVGTVAVWDLKSKSLYTTVNPGAPASMTLIKNAGPVCCAEWINTARGDFATGHDAGVVLVWALPVLEGGEAVMLAPLRLVTGAAEPIRALRHVYAKRESLLLLGGHAQGEPEGLALISLPFVVKPGTRQARSPADGEQELILRFPVEAGVVGFDLVPASGAVSGQDNQFGILVLNPGGRLMVHDLCGSPPSSPTPPLQALKPPTCTAAVIVPIMRPKGAVAHCLTLKAMRQAAPFTPWEGAKGVLEGGMAPDPPKNQPVSAVWVTGYQDGRVRLWDVYSEVPMLLANAPISAAALGSGKLRMHAVTAVEMVWEHGILVSGHSKGEVRIYQFVSRAGMSTCATFSHVGEEHDLHEIQETAGFQLKLRSTLHVAEITAVSYAVACKSVAVGDKSGAISLIDLSTPAVVWYQMPCQIPIAHVFVSNVPLPPKRERHEALCAPANTAPEGTPHRCVLVATIDSQAGILDALQGFPLNRKGLLSPRTPSHTCRMEPLDATGFPLWMSRQQLLYNLDDSGSIRKRSLARELDNDADALSMDALALMSPMTNRRETDGATASTAPAREFDLDEMDDMDVDELLRAAAEQVEEAANQEEMKLKSKPKKPGKDIKASPDEKVSKKSAKSGLPPPISETDDSIADLSRLSRTSTPYVGPPINADAPAAYILLVGALHIRLYTVASILSGNHATAKKLTIADGTTLVYAATYHVHGAPGLVVLAKRGESYFWQIYSLPGLELLRESPLEAMVGPWQLAVPQGHRNYTSVAAISPFGRIMLVGEGNELVQAALSAAVPHPLACLDLFDWELSAAATAADMAMEQSAAHGGGNSGSPHAHKPRRTTADRNAAAASTSASEPEQHAGPNRLYVAPAVLGNVFRNVASGMKTAVNTGVAGISAVKGVAMSAWQQEDPNQQYSRPGTSASTRPGAQTNDSDSDVSEMSGGEDDDGGQPQQAPMVEVKAVRVGGPTLTYYKPADPPPEDVARAELFGGAPSNRGRATSAAGSAVVARSVDEIKKSYGRGATSKVNETRSAAEEARNKLLERGEKLSRLEEKTTTMEDAAVDFVSMSRKLMEQKKKWWQP